MKTRRNQYEFKPVLKRGLAHEPLCGYSRSGDRPECQNIEHKPVLITIKRRKTCTRTKIQTKIEDLPNEILFKIFSHLHFKSLGRCAQLSHRFKNIAHCPIFWETVVEKNKEIPAGFVKLAISLGSLYPSHPIQIPEELPKILKNYTKAAIRTQPTDLLLWSAYYFRCLANGEIPPVKERLEYPLPETWYGLTPGLIRVLHKQLGTKTNVNIQTLRKKWRGLSLELDDLDKAIKEGGFKGKNEIEWRRFLALISIGVSHNKDPIQAMKIVSESFSDQSKGEGCSMNTEDFINMFKHVAIIKKIDEGRTKDIVSYLEQAGVKQDGILSHENFKTDLCPPLS